jgi:hypothetical protein
MRFCDISEKASPARDVGMGRLSRMALPKANDGTWWDWVPL